MKRAGLLLLLITGTGGDAWSASPETQRRLMREIEQGRQELSEKESAAISESMAATRELSRKYYRLMLDQGPAAAPAQAARKEAEEGAEALVKEGQARSAREREEALKKEDAVFKKHRRMAGLREPGPAPKGAPRGQPSAVRPKGAGALSPVATETEPTPVEQIVIDGADVPAELVFPGKKRGRPGSAPR